jgi:hypothetical protein
VVGDDDDGFESENQAYDNHCGKAKVMVRLEAYKENKGDTNVRISP